VATTVGAKREAVAYRNALIKDEAFAFPKAFLRLHGFEIAQDAALKMIDFVDPLGAQEGG
jgi:hypothetical protein